jgi:glutathione synthase/RimK-type ligase-like ATP-grasp enzyme
MSDGSRPPDIDVTIATHGAMADGSTDDRLLAGALARRGARVRLAVWNDPAVHWARSVATVIRSTWDYHLQPAAWFDWLASAAPLTRLINDAKIVRWNSDKRYLADLRAAGVPIVPTEFVVRGAAVDLAARCAGLGWDDVVVKPGIGASAKGAGRFAGAAIGERGQAHLDGLLRHGDALVQPFQRAVEGERERSLVYIGGRFSHAFTKPAFLSGTGDGLGEARHEATPGERALAEAAVIAAPGPVTYARVDMVPTADGPRLMELELIEPDLGLRLAPASIEALADAIVAVTPASPRLAIRRPLGDDADA